MILHIKSRKRFEVGKGLLETLLMIVIMSMIAVIMYFNQIIYIYISLAITFMSILIFSVKFVEWLFQSKEDCKVFKNNKIKESKEE